MSTQKSQSHKRQEQNNTEWLDELINKYWIFCFSYFQFY